MSVAALNFLYEEPKSNSTIVGIIIGGGMLIHSFTGGVVILFGIILTYCIDFLKSRKIKEILIFLGDFLLITSPYILLFRYPEVSQVISFSANIESSLLLVVTELYQTLNISIMSIPQITLIWPIAQGLNDLELYCPSLIFFIISVFAFIGSNKKNRQIPVIIGVLLVSLLYMFDPIVINGVPLITELDAIYPIERMVFFINIVIAISAALGFKKIERIIIKVKDRIFATNFFQSKNLINHQYEQYGMLIFLTVIIIGDFIQIANPSQNYIATWWASNIPGDYGECLLYTNFHVPAQSSVITTAETWGWSVSGGMDPFYAYMTNLIDIQPNATFYSIPPITNITINSFYQSTAFESYDYIILNSSTISLYSLLITQQNITLVFTSTNQLYFLYKIQK